MFPGLLSGRKAGGFLVCGLPETRKYQIVWGPGREVEGRRGGGHGVKLGHWELKTGTDGETF